MLRQIIYFSKAVKPMVDEDLLKILKQARNYNKQHDVTGMLLYFERGKKSFSEGRFIQVIEGELETIAALYQKIEADVRHHNVTLLINRPINRPDFGSWSMGFQAIAEADLKSENAFFSLSTQSLEAQGTERWNLALNYLKDFYALRQTG